MKTIEAIHECSVLIVDDDVSSIQMLGNMLGSLGMNVMPARSADEAILRIESKLPDLILMDLIMEPISGLDLCKKIHQNPNWSDIPVIFLSAFDEKGMVIRALESGGVDYITKPFNQAELVSRVKTHLVLKRARDRLRTLLEDKEEMMGVLAHDIKNHLSAIQMMGNLLHQKIQQPSELQEMAGSIALTSNQLLNFLKEFLCNSAIHPILIPDHQKFCPKEVMLSTLQRMQVIASHKNQTIRSEIDPVPMILQGNPIHWGQILDNLISNAIKFSPRGKDIEIYLRCSNPFIQCEILDRGPGFSEADQKKLFKRYARLSARPTEGEPSTGLGLSIVKKLVDSMDGKIGILSRKGTGTQFVLTFRNHFFEPSQNTSNSLNPPLYSTAHV